MKRLRTDGQRRILHRQRVRFYKIMRRFVYADDATKTDLELVTAVVRRHFLDLGKPLIDPNE